MDWKDIGAAGIFIILVLREVKSMWSARSGSETTPEPRAGERSVEFWRETFRETTERAIDTHIGRQLSEMVSLLREIRDEVRDPDVVRHHHS